MMMRMMSGAGYRVEVRLVALVATQAEFPPIMTQAAQCTPRLQSARKAAALDGGISKLV